MRWLIGGFLIAHGLIHSALWVPRLPGGEAPFEPGRSWLLGEIRILALTLAAVATAAFVVAGAGYVGNQDWWPVATVAGAAVSTVLMVLTFTPWWALGLLINAALIVAALQV